PQKLELRVARVENGSISSSQTNSKETPAILQIGRKIGPDPNEPPTRVHLEFVTLSAQDTVGTDTADFSIFFELITFDPAMSTEFQADYVPNEPVTNDQGQIVGNRVAKWDDQWPDIDPTIGLFDGLVDPNITYALQVCRGFLKDPKTGDKVLVRS